MEQEAEYLLRRELGERRMAQSAHGRSARKAHRTLACAYAARRLAIGLPPLSEADGWFQPAPIRLWLGAGILAMLTITATYLQIG